MRCIRGAIAIAAAVVLTAEATVSQGGGQTREREPVRIFVCEAVSGVTRVRW